jgi:hypothetical protein
LGFPFCAARDSPGPVSASGESDEQATPRAAGGSVPAGPGETIINLDHPLPLLAGKIDWGFIE